MATAETARHRWVIPAAFVAVSAVMLIVGLAVGSDEAAAPAPATEPSIVDVEATSIYRFATLEEMVAASDAIVVGTVVATERGRLVGDPADGGVISRLVTIDVDDVLLGVDGQRPATVIVEEEGYLPDGTPISVNGVAPTMVGDHGVWFLDALDDADVPVLIVINSQGRFIADGTELRGGDQRDSLVVALQQQTLAELVDATRAAVRST